MSRIVGTRYSYRIVKGKPVRTGKIKFTTGHTAYGSLKQDLLKTARGKNGKFVQLTKKRAGQPRRVKYFYQKTAGGYTKTFYNKPKK